MDFVCLEPPCAEGALDALALVRVAVAVFLAILFVQSAADKIVDRKGNMEWLTGHFAKSPLSSVVGLMLTTITLVELAAGVLSGVGAVTLLLDGSRTIASLGALLSMAALVMLFFGQRMAKDYAGAAALVPYFILACGALIVMGVP